MRGGRWRFAGQRRHNPLVDLRVDCDTDPRGEETPRRFHLGNRPVDVAEVIDRWHGADHSYFKVRGGDGVQYILRHDLESQRWELILLTREG